MVGCRQKGKCPKCDQLITIETGWNMILSSLARKVVHIKAQTSYFYTQFATNKFITKTTVAVLRAHKAR